MKRLFLVASIAAVSLLAQPPAGPRGAGRWGFPGWGQGPRAASPVTGAPYSALEVRTTQQVLANGNVITRQQQSNLYRDSSGRTRMDTTVQRPGGQTTTRVMVTDPVAGVIRNIDALLPAVRQGLVTESDIDRSVRRLLVARFKLGMFDPPEMVKWARIPYSENAVLGPCRAGCWRPRANPLFCSRTTTTLCP